MGQITHPTLGSPMAMVSPEARLWVESSISGVPLVGISGGMTGSMYEWEDVPISNIYNNPEWGFEYIISGTAAGVAGSAIGSLIQYIGAGSYVSSITYVNNRVINIGSWV